jgi:hypothetical protein
MKSRRQSKRKAHASTRTRTRVHKTRRLSGGGASNVPLASIVVSKQDPYSGGVLMTLEEALETKSNDPIRF